MKFKEMWKKKRITVFGHTRSYSQGLMVIMTDE